MARQAITTAAARHRGGLPVTVIIDEEYLDHPLCEPVKATDESTGEEYETAQVTFRFRSAAGVALLDVMEELQGVVARPDPSNPNMVDFDALRTQVRVLREFLASVIVDSQREFLDHLISSQVIDLESLMVIFASIRGGEAGGLDPTPQASSPDGSPPTGSSSTGGAPPEASMPPPSPTTDS